MRKTSPKTSKKLPVWKRIVFGSVAILFPLVILVLIELILRIAGYGTDYELYNKVVKNGQEYYVMNNKIGEKYFSTVSYKQSQNRHFLKEKPENSLRIFVLGSSTVVGFPYPANISFPSQLERMLQRSFPDRIVEVINTSITAVNSFTLLDFTKMIMDYDPDAILFYGGHNEFYGAMGVGSSVAVGKSRWYKLLYLELKNLRFYQGAMNTIAGIARNNGDENKRVTKTLMERIVKKSQIAYKSNDYQIALEQYIKNINSIVDICNKNEVPLIISNLVSNVKDLEPFQGIDHPDHPNAESVYQLAVKKYKAGDFQNAKKEFIKAKDLDGIRFRASNELNNRLRMIAKNSKIPMVDMVKIFEDHSVNGIIGDELMTEHVHPNKLGYFLMAKGFYHKFVETFKYKDLNVLSKDELEHCFQQTQLSEFDSIYSNLILTSLKSGWPFKKEKDMNTFIKEYTPTSIIDSLAHEAIVTRDGNLAGRHNQLAEYYLQQGDSLKAAKEFYSLAQMLEFSEEFYKTAARLFSLNGESNFAINLLNEAFLRYRNPDFLLLMSDVFIKKRMFKEAIPSLKGYVSKTKSSEKKYQGLIRLFNCSNELDDSENSQKYLAQIKQIKPGFSSSNNQEVKLVRLSANSSKKLKKARQLLKSKKLDQALHILLEINSYEENMLVTAMIGRVKLDLEHKDAHIYLEKVFKENASDPDLMQSLVVAHIYGGNKKRADEILNLLKNSYPELQSIKKLDKMVNGE